MFKLFVGKGWFNVSRKVIRHLEFCYHSGIHIHISSFALNVLEGMLEVVKELAEQ